MFKKRIRVACVVFATMLVLLAGCSVWWIITEKNSTGTGKMEVIAGSADMVDGVTVSTGILGKRAYSKLSRYRLINLDRKAEYFYRTERTEITGGQTKTGIDYEKYDVSELRNRWCYTSLLSDFPQYQTAGMHMVKGNEISYDLKWHLDDGYSAYRNDLEQSGITEYRIEDYVTFSAEDEYLYYYDGEGPDCYEAFCMMPADGTSYRGTQICEVNGGVYGYIETEPYVFFQCIRSNANGYRLNYWDFEETCEQIDNRSYADKLSELGMPEVHMTVKKGIYRFDENGDAACVFPMGEYADGFTFRWLVPEEETNTLMVIGTKGKRLLKYRCNLSNGNIEEQVLWDAEDEPEAFEEWKKNSRLCDMADLVTNDGRSYLYYVGGLSVFEKETRVFEGKINLPVTGCNNYFTKFRNKTIGADSVTDKVEIRLKK